MPQGFTAEPDNTLEYDLSPTPGYDKVEDISGYDPLEAAVFGDEGAVPPEEEQPVQQQPQAPVQQPLFQQPEPDIKGSVHARLRILEREKKEARRREKEAQDRLEQVIALVLEKEKPQEEEEHYEIDPVARLERKVDRVVTEIQKTREEEEQEQEERELMQEQMQANLAIRAFAGQAGELYTKAVAHLAAAEMDEYLNEHEDVTPEEAEAALLEKMERDKIKWLRQGKNPGQELFMKSIRRGFQVPIQNPFQVQQAPVPPQQPAPRNDARDEVRRENRRSVRSLSGVSGAAAPNSTNVRAYANMSEEDFQQKVLNQIKERGMVRAPLRTRDMMAGKGRSR